jgi:DNA polymerase-3 subunit epsilon
MEQRTLSAAYKFYCEKELENAHSAQADTVATYEILKAQLDRYPQTLQNDVKMLAEFSTKSKMVDYAGRIVYNDKDVPVFNFGKHKGKPVTEVFASEPSYYSWMMNGDFTLDTKKILTDIRLKMK